MSLKFHPSFHADFVPGGRYSVRFALNRSCFKFLQDGIARVPASR